MTVLGRVTRLRYNQIRFLVKVFEKLSFHRAARTLFGSLGRNTLISHALVGFRRTFKTFEEAERCVRRYNVPSHEHPANISLHSSLNQAARASDYPVLFHLQRLLQAASSQGGSGNVLDIGGSAGNLFYCYGQYLSYPRYLSWTVFEVPEHAASGRAIAEERGEHRLRFIDDLEDCRAANTVIISGSLHYFNALPGELIRFLDPPPMHLFINRTPVIDGPSVITIQDAGAYYAMSPARILSREDLIGSLAAANYHLVDEWSVPELRLIIPLDPSSSAPAYSGFYFRRREPGYPATSSLGWESAPPLVRRRRVWATIPNVRRPRFRYLLRVQSRSKRNAPPAGN